MNETDREAIREHRLAKLDRKIARMRAKADRLDRDAESKMSEFNRARGDIAYLTQPAGPRSAFGRQRQLTMDRYGKGLEMQMEAQKLRERADELERHGAVVAGDAERERQRRREAADRIIGVGSTVLDMAYGLSGTVARVNRKTYTIQFETFREARDKSFVRLLSTET